jgi:hypothetical protein
MQNPIKNMFLAATLATLAVPAVAQDNGKASTAADPKPAIPNATVQQRKQMQQQRIAHGRQSGKLSAGEAASLDRKEAGLNAEERNMREDNRGRLTSANRAKLQHQQDHMSKAIARDKHNAAVTPTHAKSVAGRRALNQQHRAAAGIKTGQLTAGEAARVETREAALNREIHSDGAENGGKLSPKERAQVNQGQNKTSNQIRLKKHNARMF